MTLLEIFSEELESEAAITKKMLERIPDDKFGWHPHPKSMTIKRLATHITDLPNWIAMALTTDELDFQNNTWKEPDLNTTVELLNNLEKAVANAQNALANAKQEILDDEWVLRSGDQVYDRSKKRQVVRMSLSQITHHRAQLGVFLRLLEIPIPGSYGPSADENGFA